MSNKGLDELETVEAFSTDIDEMYNAYLDGALSALELYTKIATAALTEI